MREFCSESRSSGSRLSISMQKDTLQSCQVSAFFTSLCKRRGKKKYNIVANMFQNK